MDELVGLVAERIAAQIRKSRDLGAQPPPAAAPVAATSRAAANPFASGSNARPSSTSNPAPPRPISPRQTRVNLDEAFPTTLDAAPAARIVPASALLAAFAGGTSLLGAIVLAEALAPPVALRHEPPHRP